VLDKHELDAINKEIDTRTSLFTRSRTMGTREGEPHPARTSSGLSLAEDDPLTACLHKAMDKGLYDYTRSLMSYHKIFEDWPMPCCEYTRVNRETIQLLTYGAGQKYTWHHDVSNFQTSMEFYRVFSTVLYLNDGFEGGGTNFLNKTYKPLPGEALFFPSNWCFPHEGQEVISGEKRVAVTWWHSVMTL